jgi:hypothetical protein
MKNKPKNIPSPYKFAGTKIFRDTTALPFLTGGPLVEKTNHGKLLNSIYASELGNYYAMGGMLKRADGSYSQRGLWDNIRANKGSGKKPTAAMLAQEKKINAKSYAKGGAMDNPPSCPPGYSWNGSECVKAKVITDPDEFAFRKAAYEDSLFLYNKYKNREPVKYGKAKDTKGKWHSPTKTYIKTENLSPSERKLYASYGSASSAWNKYINKEYDKAIETGDFTNFDKIKSPENRPIAIKANTSEYNMKNVGTGKQTKLAKYEPRFKKPEQPVIFVDKNNTKPEYYLFYKFKESNTNRPGLYEGEFILRDDTGVQVLPIANKLFIRVGESHVRN